MEVGILYQDNGLVGRRLEDSLHMGSQRNSVILGPELMELGDGFG
jgi:hypothetical protein